MKLAPVYRAFEKCKTALIKQSIINTGQHYTETLSSAFLQELDLPYPEYNLKIKSESQASFVGQAMIGIDQSLQSLNPNLVIVYGDTNSTLAGALTAAKRNCQVAHVEAGLREHDLSIPEEVNKRAIDGVCDLLFAPSVSAAQRLRDEKVLGQVHFVGDVTYDLIIQLQEQIASTFTQVKQKYNLASNYIIATCHRAVNTDNKHNLESILSALAQCQTQVIFPIHPRTANVIANLKLEAYLKYDHIKILDPIPYLETQALLSNAQSCVTDSGGLIKESYFHGVPAVIIDKQTEWVETIKSGLHRIAGPDTEAILNHLKSSKQAKSIDRSIYGNGDASEKILDMILKSLNDKEVV